MALAPRAVPWRCGGKPPQRCGAHRFLRRPSQGLRGSRIMGRRVLAVLAAILVALIGVIAVVLYANGADARAVAGQQPQTVYVAAQLVPAGTSAADAVARGLIVPTKVAAKG